MLCIFMVSMTLAGELQALHAEQEPTTPIEAKPKQKSGPKAPPGTTFIGDPLPAPKTTDITEIGLERTRCYANCPAYTLRIKADGSFRYVGEYSVERIGEFTGKVDKGRLNQVLAFIDESAFMDLATSYQASFLDGATTYILVAKDTESKIIENYANMGPATLWAIEELIDSLLETAKWDSDNAS